MGEIYISYEYWIAALQLMFAMLGMGATLTTSDFKDVVREPLSVSWGIIIQLLFVPLVAWVFINTFDISAGVAIGVALIAAIPGGTTSNIFTYFARGNVPLSISITGLTTLACLITTPFILSLLITEFVAVEFEMPTTQIVRDIIFTLLMPLIVGMVILRFLKAQATWISKWSIRLSLIVILFIVIGSISAGRLDINVFGLQNVFLISGFILVLGLATWGTTKLIGLSKKDRTAIEMEVVVRNVNLAVLIKASIFPVIAGANNDIGDKVLFTVLLYGALQLLLAAVIIKFRRM